MDNRIRVLGYPYHPNCESASARLRFWHRLESINDLVALKVYSSGDQPKDYDVLYIQKRVNVESVNLSNLAIEQDTPIVFDIDDAIGTAAHISDDKEMMRKATLVTTDTDPKAREYKGFAQKPLRVIPDGLDYFTEWYDWQPRYGVKSVCTFGWDHNVRAALPYMLQSQTYLRQFPHGAYAGYITNRNIDEYDRAGFSFVKWELATFLNNVGDYDCAILAHGDGPVDHMRCCNRFLAASFAGLLPLVKNSPEYASVAEDLGVPFLCVKRPTEIPKMITEYGENRVGILRNLRSAIWEDYKPRNQGLALYDALKEATNA